VYAIVNSALRAKNRDLVKPWRHFIWLLLHALKKLPPVTKPMLYRGIKITLDELGPKYKKSCTFQLGSFTSTTSSVDVMNTFLGDTGPRVCFHFSMVESIARDISCFSLYESEKAIILPPNMLFTVEACWDTGAGLHILQCQQQTTIDHLLVFETTTTTSIQ
jgi:hypothetical protein